MSPIALAKEDHERDAAFYKAMHGKSAEQRSAFLAMLGKDSKSQQVAADAYFKHWDNKDARIETEADREVGFIERSYQRKKLIDIARIGRMIMSI
jgi:sterol 24-C-methyltransferase